ncbi:MAG: IS4 family transposase [Planctomycetota bacterium]
MHTPFFPALRARLAPMGRRVEQLRQQSLCHLERLLNPFLPPGLLSQADEGPNSRERVFSVRRTFFGFLYQVLTPKTSCREIVRQVQALFALHEAGPVDESTSAYCQARKRLPLDRLCRVRVAVAAAGQSMAQLWHGLRPKVMDGTTTSAPDTPKNQRAYPQSASQKPGCGFPLIRLVGVFSLSTGVLLDYAKGNKHQHELRLLWKLLDQFKPGDLAVADRGFCSYVLLAVLLKLGVASLFRLHQRRPADLRKGKRLGKNDRLFTWLMPPQKPRWLPQYWWKRIPPELTVRVIRFRLCNPGYRPESVTMVTTPLDPQEYPARDIALLYARRWKIELWFRDIKTSMGMEVLRGKSPQLLHKELEMFFIAYNLIRCLILQAGVCNDVEVDRMSFKGTVDSVRQFSLGIAQARSKKKQSQLIVELLEVIARDQVPERPGRREPRAVKRRPKAFPLLNKPRDEFKEIFHRNRYWKNNPRKSCA